MKKVKQILTAKELKVSHSAVSQWFSGTTTPKFKHMSEMERIFKIPLTAWKDIKSYVTEIVTNNDIKK